jgi:type IV pilus assembly protein PilQ
VPARIVLDIFGSAKQPGRAEIFRVDTSTVATMRVSQVEGGLRLTTDIAAATVPAYTIMQEDGGLRIVIGAENPNATARKEATLVRAGVRGDIRATDASATSTSGASRSVGTDSVPGDDKKYTGQKISLDFKDADIKNVFRLLREVSGKNLVVTDDVSRRVTISLFEVPWDQALDLIIETNGLAKEEVGNVMRISTAARLSTEKKQQQDARNASRIAEIPQLSYLTVNYAKAKDVVEKVKLLIKGGADLVPDDRSNFIVVRGSKTDLEEVVQIVTKLDVRTPQVLIESNLIETTPTFSRSLGIEMETLFNQGRVRTSDRFIAGPPFAGSPQPTPLINQLVIPNTGFRFGYFGNNITSILSAAEQEGNVKIISRPSVVTLNNEQSTIESTNIIRIRTSAATVGEAGNLREIKAGITLKVTPQVSADGFVLLKIEAKSSTLDFGNSVDGIPAEINREAKAMVLVKDGETVVIGGIMKDTSSNSDTGVPYLKDIPALGWLFKRSSWRKDFEELVVFITPRIMAAGSENLPTAEQIWREQMKQTDGPAPAQTSLKP